MGHGLASPTLVHAGVHEGSCAGLGRTISDNFFSRSHCTFFCSILVCRFAYALSFVGLSKNVVAIWCFKKYFSCL